MGCRTTRPPDQLVRVWRSPDGGLHLGKGPGRGAWLCRDSGPCLEAASRRRAFDRAFRAPVDRDEVERLRQAVDRRGQGGSPAVM